MNRDASQDHLNSRLGKKVETENESQSLKSNPSKANSKIRIGSEARKDSLNVLATLEPTKQILEQTKSIHKLYEQLAAAWTAN
jgi:hypothetical protein